MAFSYEFDPAKGFVALPSDVMDIDMSPGAFRVLVELCRMANRIGECWPSLGQLSERIGRSKAAISGYITELRELDLLATVNQKMANGYNYRLKYCVTFWQNWRNQLGAGAAPRDVQKDECSVQPVERRVNSKNHKHKTNTTITVSEKSDGSPKLVSVFSKWSDLAKAAPFPHFKEPASTELIAETKNLLAKNKPKTLIERDYQTDLKRVWDALGVSILQDQLVSQATQLKANKTTSAGFDALQKCILSTWKPHWRKPPTGEQFAQFLTHAQGMNREEGMYRMLEQYLRRWEISQNKLQHRCASPSLSLNRAA